MYQSGSDRAFRDREVARSSFKLAEVFGRLGNPAEADKYQLQADELRKALTGDEYTSDASEHDYDMLVSLWAR